MSRLIPILAIMALLVGLSTVAHAQGAAPHRRDAGVTSSADTGGIHTPSHEHTPAPPLASPDKNIEEKP